MTLFSRVTEICRERLPSIRVARITIDSIYDLDKMLQPGIRFGVTVRNTSELIGTPIAQIEFFYFSVDVMDGDERMIIQRMETWRNGTYKAFYRIFYDEVCQTRLDGLDGVELGWRNAYDVFQLNSQVMALLGENIERVLTGEIKSHSHPSSNYVLDSSSSQYGYYVMEQGAAMQASKSVPAENRFKHLTISFQTLTAWESWQFIGDDIETQWNNVDYWQQKDAKAGAILNMDAWYPLETGYYQISDEEAPNYAPSVVPANLRVKSLILTFLEGVESPAAYQFTDSSTGYFTDPNSWKKLAYLSDIPTEHLIQQKINLSSFVWNASSDGTPTTLAAATDACPADVRKMGLNIILKNSAGKWEVWQFIGTNIVAQFENVAYWQRIDTAQHDFINLTEKVPPIAAYYLMNDDASENQYAYNYVPEEYKIPGITITFKTATSWEIWQFIGTDITTQWDNLDYWREIPVDPSLALGEELGTAYEGSKGKANADAIASISSDLSTAVSKLGGIQDFAEVNQNAFSRIKIGSSTIASNDKTDTFELVEGSNITLSSSGKKITISSSFVDAGYVQVGSAQIVYVPEDSDTGTPGYIKIQHADGSTAMHLVTTGGQTMYSTGVPAAIEEHLCNVYRLLYFGGEPPMEDVITGEQYYDTVEDKIHTAINTEVGGEFLVWDIGGVAPKDNTLYVSESDYIYNTCRLWLYKEGYMRSLGIVQPQMDNAIFLSKNDEVMVTYNTSEDKADIIIGNRVKNRFMVIVPSTTSGVIVVNMIFNSIVPFGFLAEYEIYLYIESENVTNTLLSTECPLEPSETYSSGLILGTLQSTDIIGKGLHKLTYIRDRAAADTHMGLYVKHEYFEKV